MKLVNLTGKDIQFALHFLIYKLFINYYLFSALKRVDIVLGMLMDGLRMYGFEHCVNIVLTADHGMETGLCEDQIEILSSAEHLLDQLYVNAK